MAPSERSLRITVLFAMVSVTLVIIVLGVYAIRNNEMASNQSIQKANVVDTLYKVAQNPAIGTYLTDARGMTLYTSSQDKPGVSRCVGTCSATWLPYQATIKASVLPGKLRIISRSDGTLQYTWNDQPLYFFSGDTKPGDINGISSNGTWKVAT